MNEVESLKIIATRYYDQAWQYGTVRVSKVQYASIFTKRYGMPVRYSLFGKYGTLVRGLNVRTKCTNVQYNANTVRYVTTLATR